MWLFVFRTSWKGHAWGELQFDNSIWYYGISRGIKSQTGFSVAKYGMFQNAFHTSQVKSNFLIFWIKPIYTPSHTRTLKDVVTESLSVLASCYILLNCSQNKAVSRDVTTFHTCPTLLGVNWKCEITTSWMKYTQRRSKWECCVHQQYIYISMFTWKIHILSQPTQVLWILIIAVIIYYNVFTERERIPPKSAWYMVKM